MGGRNDDSIVKENVRSAREINIQVTNLDELNQELAKIFGSSNLKKTFYIIHIDSGIVKGELQIAVLQDEINFLKFNWFAFKKFNFSPNIFPFGLFHFFFSCKGDLKIRDVKSNLLIPQLRLGVLRSFQSGKTDLEFKSGRKYEFTMINFLRRANKKSPGNFSDTYYQLYEELTDGGGFFTHLSNYNLKLNDLHKELGNVPNQPGLRMLYLKAKCNELVVAYISQLEKDREKPYSSGLTKNQMDAVWQAIDVIKDNLTENYTVPEIAKMVFMSPSQLQYCFKAMFNQTVNEYILNTRLELSKQLLEDPAYYISDVVYKVGLTSKSYFSKIFKNKYHISPSQYRRQHLKPIQHESIEY